MGAEADGLVMVVAVVVVVVVSAIPDWVVVIVCCGAAGRFGWVAVRAGAVDGYIDRFLVGDGQ